MRKDRKKRGGFFLRGICLFFLVTSGVTTPVQVQAKETAFTKEGEFYLIESAADLRKLAVLVNGEEEVEPGVPANEASYLLTRDIDISEYCKEEGGWEPIGWREGAGEYSNDTRQFNGTFDGGGHMITGLYINRPKEVGLGLFGLSRTESWFGYSYTGSDYNRDRTVIRNLYIKDCEVTGKSYVGGVIGYMDATLEYPNGEVDIVNCHVTGQIKGNMSGGIGGRVAAVKDSSFTGTVESPDGAGGIAAQARHIEDCVFHGDVTGRTYVGGMAGRAGCVRDSYVTGTVTGYNRVGGIAGTGARLTGCYTRADVSGHAVTGGLAGFVYNGTALAMEEGSRSSDEELRNCLSAGYRISSVPKANIEEYFGEGYNGYVYGHISTEFLKPDTVGNLYYREKMIREDFTDTPYETAEAPCKAYNCDFMDEPDFREIFHTERIKFDDVWMCVTDYAWPCWHGKRKAGLAIPP